MDLITGDPRPATKQDVVELTRLNDALESTKLCMSPIIQDVESSLVDVHSGSHVLQHNKASLGMSRRRQPGTIYY